MKNVSINAGHFKRLLERERDRCQRRVQFVDQTGLAGSVGENTAELSAYDNHPADLGSETFERQKDLGLKLDAGFFIGEIDDALERIEKGSYGKCARCGTPIAEGRLEAVPWTRYCLGCKEEEEKRPDGLRPAEEIPLWPPFGRTFNDRSERPGIDGEDIWESLEAYGTSNTPQDQPGSHDYHDMSRVSGDRGFVHPVEGMIDDKGDVVQDIEGG